MRRALCERCWQLERIVQLWDTQPKFFGTCQRCFNVDQCAMDCGYSWATGMYMPSKEFNTDFYTTQAAFQLASYPTICLMLGSEKRSRLAGAYARAVKQCLTYNPTSKPDYRTIKGMVLADEELKGFIGILLLNIIVGLISKVIVDWIYNNWTETPNGEAGDGERRQ